MVGSEERFEKVGEHSVGTTEVTKRSPEMDEQCDNHPVVGMVFPHAVGAVIVGTMADHRIAPALVQAR